MKDALVDRLRDLLGTAQVLLGEDVSARFDGWPENTRLTARCIARPLDTEETAAVVKACSAAGACVVTHGGRTGLVRGTRAEPKDVVLSLERMTDIGPVEPYGATLTVQAGATLQAVQDAAAGAGFLYPVDIGARGTATIGGAIATNAGGNSVLRYGMTRNQVLGLEVVLADGRIVSSMNTLQKNNAGYDLKQLFIGTEGTLGVVTRAVLKLQPSPGPAATAFLGLTGFPQTLDLLRLLRLRAGGALTSFEVMWPEFVEIVHRQGGRALPFSGLHGAYALVEIRCPDADERLDAALAEAWELDLLVDGAVAQTKGQADSFWALRDDIPAIVREMKPCLIYDVSVPQTEMHGYVSKVAERLRAISSSARLVIFGHIADGNLHLVASAGPNETQDRSRLDTAVYEPLQSFNGSISAEHGIGLEKVPFLTVSRNEEEISLMRRLKGLLDPKNTLNPGKVLGACVV